MSELQRAIFAGLQPGGDLEETLAELDGEAVSSRRDAAAVCDALQRVSVTTGNGDRLLSRQLYELAALFQGVESAPACALLRNSGVPHLIRAFDETYEHAEDSDDLDTLMFLLKVMAIYGTSEGTERVIRAARLPLCPDGFMWSVIFGFYTADHPCLEQLSAALSEPLPEQFIAVALADTVNGVLIGGGEMKHAFDSDAGKSRLRRWLVNKNPKYFSYARTATAALPFVSNPERDDLLAVAMNHPGDGVRMEATWASAKLGHDEALRRLSGYCLDFRYATTAVAYLEELGRSDLIPEQAVTPTAVALAEFASWLAHPSELGRPPDELELIDHRDLCWPPERDERPFWLIRYRVRDNSGLGEGETGVGLVGSITFCLFSSALGQRPPDDGYAIHCYWEMCGEGLITETDAEVEPAADHQDLVEQCSGLGVSEVTVLQTARLSESLRYPQQEVGLASARMGDEHGWVVMDGVRSEWYSAADMPSEASPSAVLMVHVGRQLLGLTGDVDRRQYLRHPEPLGGAETIRAYETLLAEFGGKSPAEQLEVVQALGEHFDAYATAKAEATRRSRDAVVVDLYERLLAVVDTMSDEYRQDALDSFGPLADCLETYAQALVSTGRGASIDSAIERLAPLWDHNSGYSVLGSMAFKCRRYELAERFLLKLRASYADWHRCEEMGELAEIWHRQGRDEDAKELLVECLQKVAKEAETATGSDRDLFDEWSQNHRLTYLRLFPGSAEADLAELTH